MAELDRDLRVVGTLTDVTTIDDQQFIDLAFEADDGPQLSIVDPETAVSEDRIGERVIVDIAITTIDSIRPSNTENATVERTGLGTAFLRGSFNSQTLKGEVLSAEVDLGVAKASIPYHTEEFRKLSKMNEIAREYDIKDADYVEATGVELTLLDIEPADETSPYSKTPISDIELRLKYDTGFEQAVTEQGTLDLLVDFRLIVGETYVVGSADGRWADDYMTGHLSGLLDCCTDILDGNETEYLFLVENLTYEFTPTIDPDGVRFQYKTGEFQLNRDLPRDGILLDRTAFVREVLQTAKTYEERIRTLNPDLKDDLEILRDHIESTEARIATYTQDGPPRTLPVKVVDCIPDAVYQGTVYDQTVVLEALGTRFGAFDKNMAVSESDLKDRLALELFLFMPSVEPAPGRNPAINPADDHLDWQGHTFIGTAHWHTDETETDHLYLDIGPGELRIGKAEVEIAIDDGDQIAVTASRLDVSDVATTLTETPDSDADLIPTTDTDRLCAIITDTEASPEKRTAALQELDPQADADIISALSTAIQASSEQSVREAAIDALAAIESPDAVDTLAELLTADATMTTDQGLILRELRSREDTRCIEHIEDVARNASDADVRRMAVTVFAGLAGEQVFDLLLEILDSDPNEAVVREAASALAATGHPDLQDAFVTRMQTVEDSMIRNAILSAIDRSKDWAVDVVLEALYDSDEDIQRNAIFQAQWFDDNRVIEPLCRLIQSSDDSVIQARAANAFTEIERHVLTDTQQRYVAKTLLDSLEVSAENVRSNALTALKTHYHPIAFAPLSEFITATDDDTHLAKALRALARIGDDRATGIAVEHLSHPSKDVRKAACHACSRLKVTEALPEIRDLAANDPDQRVRKRAVKTARKLTIRGRRHGTIDAQQCTELVEQLRDIILTDPETEVQRAGVQALEKLHRLEDTEQVTDALKTITSAGIDSEIRNRAADALQ